MRQLERQVVLSVLDRKWREHLYEMDYLQEGIQLRSYGQRDPLVEYQREGFTMFTTMMDAIKEESVGLLFNLEVQVAAPEAAPEPDDADDDGSASAPAAPRTIAQEAAASDGGRHAAPATSGARLAGTEAGGSAASTPRPSIDGDSSASSGGAAGRHRKLRRDAPLMYEGTPRNAKCPCGSGRAYKRCHGDPRSAL